MALKSFKIMGIRAVFPQLDEFSDNSPKHYEKVEAIQKVSCIKKQVVLFLMGLLC